MDIDDALENNGWSIMNEEIIIWQFAVAVTGLAIGSVAYSLGGYKGKWKRRFVGSFIISSTFIGICAWRDLWTPWLLLSYPMLIGTFCLPYGADTLFPKLVKRSTVVLACLTIGIGFCALHGGKAWWVLIPNAGISAWSIFLGIKSNIQARAEEGFICLLLCMGLMMYPFIV